MKKEVKVGIIMVIVLSVVIWGFNFLKGKNFFSNKKKYYVIYNDISGLTESNGLYVKGYKVGHVGEIEFTDKSLTKIKVCLAIESDIQIPEGTVARIYTMDLIGNKAVELKFSNKSKILKENEFLIGDVEVSVAEQLEPYKAQAYSLFKSIDSLSTSVNRIFDPATVKNYREIVRNVRYTTDAMASSSYLLTVSFQNIQDITANIRNSNQKINHILNNVDAISDSISQMQLKTTLNKLNQSIDETNVIIANLKNGQGTLGKLLTNDTLYYNLNRSVVNVDSLVEDLKQNPKKYLNFSVFGSKK
jgi:phospholipid/cholesterol/gamma-HCH transport system substrate-binding protein